MKNNTLCKLLFLLVVLFTVSCKKDREKDDSSYVKIKMNGDWVTLAGLGELGPDLGDASLTDLGVNGYSEDGKNTFSISVQVSGPNFNPGTYSSDKYPEYYMIVDYSENPDINTIRWYEIEDASNQPPSKYTVNITSITPTQIKGNFTGNYLYDNSLSTDPDGGIVYITEGEFQVKRVR